MAATTSVLNNSDLATLIFRQFVPNWNLADEGNYQGRLEVVKERKQLRNLALCCRAFKLPASQLLWSHLDSFDPLINLLPSGFQTEDEDEDSIEALPEDCNFLVYASWVHTVDYAAGYRTSLSVASITPATYLKMARACAIEGLCIFPVLRSVNFRSFGPPAGLTPTTDPDVQSRVAPTTLLEKQNLSKIYCFMAFLLASQAPGLQSLALCNYHLKANDANITSLGNAITAAVFKNTNLRTLDLRLSAPIRIDHQALLNLLKTLPQLESLTLDIHLPDHVQDHSQVVPPAVDHAKLDHLKMVHLFIRGATNILCECYPDAILKKMTKLTIVTGNELVHDLDYNPLLDALPTPYTWDTIDIWADPWSGFGSSYVTAILERVRHVREFQFRSAALTYWAGDFQEMIQAAFPQMHDDRIANMKTLILPWPCETPYPCNLWSSLTLDDLFCVAEMAIGLEHLHARILPGSFKDAGRPSLSIAQCLDLIQSSPSSRSTLKTLAIYDGRMDSESGDRNSMNVSLTIEEGLGLARILDHLFPDLEAVKPYSEQFEKAQYWKDCWVHVEHARKMYQELRRLRAGGVLATGSD